MTINALIASAQNAVHSSGCGGAADGIDFLWVSVLSFSHEAVKSMFHTQMRWVSPLTHPVSLTHLPHVPGFPGPAPPDSLAAVMTSALHCTVLASPNGHFSRT